MRLLLAFSLLSAGCVPEPEPLPTARSAEEADAQMELTDAPPLTQLLYDYAFLPQVQARQQRVRLLIWLRHMELGAYQLRALDELWQRADAERRQVESAQRAYVEETEPEIAAAYDQLWEQLSAGVALDDPALTEAAGPLLEVRPDMVRSNELLAMRLEGVRSVLEAERPWLATLSPKQEALLSDALFLLRHRLDPYANPGDFRALVGTVFSAGDYGTLTRGSFTPESDQLDLSRLWSDYSKDEISGPVFSDARRELILYMVLLEPALPEAIAAALGEEAGEGEAPEGEGPVSEAPEAGDPPPGDGAPPQEGDPPQ